ncbi:MAG: dockerin type I domain-containing protein [Planctomycetota bacterium]
MRLKSTCPDPDPEAFETPVICNLIVHQGLGDMNCDGITNSYDIDHFIQAVGDPAQYIEDHDGDPYPPCDLMLADCNGDGLVNSYDIDAFIAWVGCAGQP